MDVEFVDGPSSGADETEELGEHRPGPPRWAYVLLAVALLAVALVVIVQRGGDPVPRAARTAPGSSTASDEPSSPTGPTTSPLARGVDPVLFSVYVKSREQVAAGNLVRGGSSSGCRSVAVGTHPQRLITRVFVRALDGFIVRDSAVILDQNAGLCSLQVRAADGRGAVALLVVTAPVSSTALTSTGMATRDSARVGGDYVEYAGFQGSDGWQVTVGASGPRSRLPAAAVLHTIATSTALRW